MVKDPKTAQNVYVPAKSNKNFTAHERHKRSNETRQNSVEAHARKRAYFKNILARTLRSELEPINKKVIFEAEDDDARLTDEQDRQLSPETAEGKLDLLAGSSDEELEAENNRMCIKPQFDGSKGAKVLKLQTKVGCDPRFAVSENFVDSDEDSDTDNRDRGNQTAENSEKSRMLDILDSMKIKPQASHSSISEDKKKNILHKMIRFDPGNIEHRRYEKVIPPKLSQIDVNMEPIHCLSQRTCDPTAKKFYKVDPSINIARNIETSTEKPFSITALIGQVEEEIESSKKPWSTDIAKHLCLKTDSTEVVKSTDTLKPVCTKSDSRRTFKLSSSFLTTSITSTIQDEVKLFASSKDQSQLETEWQRKRSKFLEANRIRQRRYNQSKRKRRSKLSDIPQL